MLEIILINAIYIFSVISLLLNCLHIYQLESYDCQKNYIWLRANFGFVFKKYVLINVALFFINYCFFIVLSELFFSIYFYILFLPCFIFVSYYDEIFKNIIHKKPLRFTKRVIRFILIFTFLYLIILNLIFVKFISLKVLYCFLPLNFVLHSLIFFVSHFVSVAIEKIIAKYYISSAKRILIKSNVVTTIGVTGSFGKTSVKNFIYTILSEKYNTLATPKSFNTPMGVVKTIRENLNFQHKIFVVEMGADKKGDIRQLCEIVYPDMGVLTSIGKQHLSTFKSFENIIRTKNELSDFVKAISGIMVFNLDDANVLDAYLRYPNKKYGVSVNIANHENFKDKKFFDKEIILSADNLTLSEKGCRFDILKNNENFITAESVLIGRHNVLNILLAVAIAIELNLSKNEIVAGIRKLKPIPNRLEIKKLANGATLIDNGFNSNPTSAQISLEVLSLFNNKNKIVITPGLVELANEQYTENYLFGKSIAKVADTAIIVNNVNKNSLTAGLFDGGMKKNKIIYFENFNTSLIDYLKTLTKDEVVLIENDLPDNYK